MRWWTGGRRRVGWSYDRRRRRAAHFSSAAAAWLYGRRRRRRRRRQTGWENTETAQSLNRRFFWFYRGQSLHLWSPLGGWLRRVNCEYACSAQFHSPIEGHFWRFWGSLTQRLPYIIFVHNHTLTHGDYWMCSCVCKATANHSIAIIYYKVKVQRFGEFTSLRLDWPRVGLSANCPCAIVSRCFSKCVDLSKTGCAENNQALPGGGCRRQRTGSRCSTWSCGQEMSGGHQLLSVSTTHWWRRLWWGYLKLCFMYHTITWSLCCYCWQFSDLF